ncbi:MAG: hypothetical protein SOW25_03665 [Helicobacter sp.]|nr:hypothetical protein [Helicobacter sp.]
MEKMVIKKAVILSADVAKNHNELPSCFSLVSGGGGAISNPLN